MKLKIHFHSDCPFFAGCENMLVNLWGSAELRQLYHVSFSYRESQAYTSGLQKRVNVDFPLYPLKIFDASSVGHRAPGFSNGIKKVLKVVLREALEYPTFFYEVLVLTRLFRRIRPQILHINNGGYPGALSCRAAAVAAKLCGVETILMVVNNLAVPYKSYKRWLDWPVDRLVVNCVSRFITGSKVAGDRLRLTLKLTPEKLVTLHNGIKSRKLTENATETRDRIGIKDFEGVVFGVVALMEKRKGHQVLLEALLQMRSTDPNALSSIIILFEGTGPLESELADFVRNNNLECCVRFVGVETNVFNFIKMLDVLVLPSIENEDFPNVILEGMALSKPVIASALAGTPEQVINNVSGLLVPPGDRVELASALRKLAFNKELRHKFGVNALERFQENFTDEKAVKRYINLYENAGRGS